MHNRPTEAEPTRQDGDKYVGVQRKEQHLENRIEGDESRAVVGIAIGQVVPDDHHRDTTGEPDHNQAHHVLGPVAQEDDRQREHQDRADNPVLDQG